jgi:hypothetical protein
MKPIKFFTYCASIIMLVLLTTAFIDSKKTVNKNFQTVDAKGFALLELFTSEGCSSCPAADELLAKIQKETQDKPVYILAYHVDYWNRLGWKDVFSSPEYSKRQVAYSHTLNAEVYTPQVVINGKAECVGSDEPSLRSAITNALTTAPTATVALQAQQNGDNLTVNYQVSGNTNASRLLLAVVQKSAISKVQRGENAGRTLSHAQIVRSLQAVDLNAQKKGLSVIKLPQGFNTQNWEIVGFIQNPTGGEILSATKASFNNNATSAGL